MAELRKALDQSRVPIRLVDLAAPDRLDMRLSSADIHIVSLRDEWTGTVVPSKFFGALAMGRPVLFVGSSDSAIARWIQELKVGWVLDRSRVQNVALDLIRWSQCPAEKIRLFQHCHEVYQREFSRRRSIDRWDDSLRSLLSFPLSKIDP